jgi:hypothetical protein
MIFDLRIRRLKVRLRPTPEALPVRGHLGLPCQRIHAALRWRLLSPCQPLPLLLLAMVASLLFAWVFQ